MVEGRENRGALCPFVRMVTGDATTAVVTHAFRVGSRLEECLLSGCEFCQCSQPVVGYDAM